MNRPRRDGPPNGTTLGRTLTLVLAMAALLGGAPVSDAAERGRGGKSATARKRPAPKRRPPPPAAEPAPAQAAPSVPTASRSAAAAEAEAAAPAPRPGKPRVYTFGGLDLEGKLRTPQLLYFRSRMRQELDTSTPARRSFMKELEATANAQGL